MSKIEIPKKTIGYTTGVFDMFHIGHLKVIQQARSKCDYLIVGVTADQLCVERKNKAPIIPEWERMEIVRAIRYVDQVVLETTLDKLKAWDELQFNIIFKGDDWRGTSQWIALEREFETRGVRTVFFPYTQHISSTVLRRVLLDTKGDRGREDEAQG